MEQVPFWAQLSSDDNESDEMFRLDTDERVCPEEELMMIADPSNSCRNSETRTSTRLYGSPR